MLINISYNTFSFADSHAFLRNLWHEAFGDSEEFVDAFFNHCASDEVLHTLSLDGRPVSALYALPYTVMYNGQINSVAYIYAVATDKEFRGQGLMRHLMAHVHESLCKSGCAAALLLPSSPSLADYYASMGYRVCASRRTALLECGSCDGSLCVKCEALDNDSYAFICNSLARRKNNIIHPKSSLAMNVASCRLSGGGLFIAKRCDTVVAAAFVTIEEGQPLILDIYAYDNEAKNTLTGYICNHYAVTSLPLLVCDNDEGVPFAMVLPFDSSFPTNIGLQLMLDR